ncbi:MAG: NUDIX domain-containing protein [Cyanobacteria bacterium J06639_14]
MPHTVTRECIGQGIVLSLGQEVPLFRLGAFAIIFDEHQRVLLCHRCDFDAWNLPGGGVETGELPPEAVIREVKEETGLDVEVEQLVGIYGKTDKDELVFAFRCQIIGGRLTATAEADESQYFRLEHLPINTIPSHVERIHDALKLSDTPIFCRQVSPSIQARLAQLQG